MPVRLAGAGALSPGSHLRAYYVAAALARLADEMVAVAVVLLVLDRTRSAALAGFTVTAYTLPTLVSGPFLGAWLDRTVHRRGVLAGSQAVIAAAMGGLLAAAGHAPDWLLPLPALLAGAVVPMTSGGFTSMLADLTSDSSLTRAYAVDAATFNVAAIVGPAAAGAIAATLGSGSSVALVSVAAAASLVGIAALPANPGARGGISARPSFLTSVRVGLRHLVGTPPLRGATVASTVGLGAVGMLTVAFPLRAEELGATRAAGGYLWAAVEVGAVTGTLLLARHQERFRPERVVFGGLAGYGLGMAAWPLAPSLPAALVLAALAGLADGPALAALFAARQRYTPSFLRAQIFTTGASLKIGAYSLGAAVGGQLVPYLDPGRVIALVAAAQLVAAGAGLLTARFPLSRVTSTAGDR